MRGTTFSDSVNQRFFDPTEGAVKVWNERGELDRVEAGQPTAWGVLVVPAEPMEGVTISGQLAHRESDRKIILHDPRTGMILKLRSLLDS